jgi:hypothetical protein
MRPITTALERNPWRGDDSIGLIHWRCSTDLVRSADGGTILNTAMYRVLGCMMDVVSMIILTVPIVFPVVTGRLRSDLMRHHHRDDGRTRPACNRAHNENTPVYWQPKRYGSAFCPARLMDFSLAVPANRIGGWYPSRLILVTWKNDPRRLR